MTILHRGSLAVFDISLVSRIEDLYQCTCIFKTITVAVYVYIFHNVPLSQRRTINVFVFLLSRFRIEDEFVSVFINFAKTVVLLAVLTH